MVSDEQFNQLANRVLAMQKDLITVQARVRKLEAKDFERSLE